MNMRPVALLLCLSLLAACQQKSPSDSHSTFDVQLQQEFAADFANFAPPAAGFIKQGSISRRLSVTDESQAWQALLTVCSQCGFIAHAERETGVVIIAALPPVPQAKSPSRPDPYAWPPPALCLERQGDTFLLHANWNVPYYTALKANAGLTLKDADKARIANLLFDAVETQSQSASRWPWLMQHP